MSVRTLGFLVIVWAMSAVAGDGGKLDQPAPLRFGITPVFLVDQGDFLGQWKTYLESRLGRPVEFVRRKSYAEITDLLARGQLDAAWICSFSYASNRDRLTLVTVPVYRGEPHYHSYLIVPQDDHHTLGYSDLKDKVFAFVEPRSHTGYLYPRYEVKKLGHDPDTYFGETFFTWSHIDAIAAVADQFADAAAVDSYIWDSLQIKHPELTRQTRVVARSKRFGFPPVVAGGALPDTDRQQLRQVLFGMDDDPDGRRLLALLHLNRFDEPDPQLYDEIPRIARFVSGEGDR